VHLHAAFVPPRSLRDALVALLAEQEPPPADAAAVAGRRGLFGRRTPETAAASPGPMLDVIDPEKVVLPITDFGYVASGDARRLGDALDSVCAHVSRRPTVRVAGGAALVDPDDRSVWADLAAPEEDLTAMREVAQAVVSGVQPLGFFCDRRQFRPRFPIATITDGTTVEHLEQVLEALAAYTSEAWVVDELAVLQRGSGVWRTVRIGR
jgi:hypothetical protein